MSSNFEIHPVDVPVSLLNMQKETDCAWQPRGLLIPVPGFREVGWLRKVFHSLRTESHARNPIACRSRFALYSMASAKTFSS